MKTILLPFKSQISAISSYTGNRVTNFTGNVANKQNPSANPRHSEKWHFIILLMIIVMMLGFSNSGFGQTTGDYRSNATGNWNALATWQRYNGTSWATPTSGQGTPTNTSGAITIQSPNTVTVNVAISADQVTINSGGTIMVGGLLNVQTFTIVDGTGDDLVNNGTLAIYAACTVSVQGQLKNQGSIDVQYLAGFSANLNIVSGGTLKCSTSIVSGGGNFSLASGGTIEIGSTDGITTSGATGNIQVTRTRTYAIGANYVYNGTSGAQAAGNGLPATVNSLTISNTAGVTLPSAIAVTNNLSITAGAFINLGSVTHTAGTLTLGGAGTASGSWGSTSSSATYKNNSYFAATTGIVNVNTDTRSTPGFSGLTASQSICFGTSTVTLSGTVSATGPVYPANGETVSVTINSVAQIATIAGSAGGFSIIFPTAAIPASGSAYSITYAYAGDGFLKPAPNNTSTTLKVNANPVANASQTPITCYGANDATITVLVSGGQSPYYFSDDNGSSWVPALPALGAGSWKFSDLLPGTPYRIKVKDSFGCISK